MLSDVSMGRIFVRTSLHMCQSARLGLAKLTGKGESRDNTVSMNLWSEKECSLPESKLFSVVDDYRTAVGHYIAHLPLVQANVILLDRIRF